MDTRVATDASTIGPRLRLCFASATLRVAKLSQAVQNQTEQNQAKPEQARQSKAKGQAKQSTATQCKREAKVQLWIHALQSSSTTQRSTAQHSKRKQNHTEPVVDTRVATCVSIIGPWALALSWLCFASAPSRVVIPNQIKQSKAKQSKREAKAQQ